MGTKSIKKIVCLLLILLGIQSYAQIGVYHTVVPGDTLESISKQYGISEKEIRKANPMVNQAFYVGLKLVIPKIDEELEETSSNDSDLQLPLFGVMTPNSNIKEEFKAFSFRENALNINDFLLSAGLIFGTDCSELVGFNYGLSASSYLKGGLGAYVSLTTSFPFKSADNCSFILKIGPTYRYDVSQNFFVGGVLCYSLTSVKNISKKANISGADLMPFVGYSLGNFEFSFYLDAYLRNGHSGLRFCPYLGISYLFKR